MDLEMMNAVPRVNSIDTRGDVDFWSRQCNLAIYFLRVFPVGDPARERVARELWEYRVLLAHALQQLECEYWEGWPIVGTE